MWTVLAGMFLRRASRNRMDCDRNEGRFAESVLRLSGQGVDDWPDGEELTVPCSETCCNLLRRGEAVTGASFGILGTGPLFTERMGIVV